jgi:hypothetical protein
MRVRQLTTASIETIHGLGVGYLASCLFTKGLSASIPTAGVLVY